MILVGEDWTGGVLSTNLHSIILVLIFTFVASFIYIYIYKSTSRDRTNNLDL